MLNNFQNKKFYVTKLFISSSSTYHHNNHAAEADLPVMGLEQAVHRLEKSSPKHSAQ